EEAKGEAQRATAEAARLGLAKLVTAHRTWWHSYYPASFLSFPDARLEAYYWIQIYKLGSAMRADGPILDLNGPWFNATPWPAIWWNLNIQLTYSPLFRANRLDLAESLFSNLDRNRQALIDNVPERLRGGAAAIGRSSGPDLVRPVDLATAQSDAAHEMGDLPWTMYYYWLHYRYQMDDRILRERVYPLLKLAIGNYLAYVERGDDGHWHLPPTHSPELATVPDANYDLALLRWGLETLIASAQRLGLDAPRYMEPNTFYAEAGPVIETPFSAAASIQELFLQDWGGALRVFPAVPGAWADAAFDRLRADGAFLVSGVRRDGRTAWVRIE